MSRLLLLVLLLVQTAAWSKNYSVDDFIQFPKYRTIKISPDGKHIAANFQEGSQVKLVIIQLGSNKIRGTYEFGDNRQIRNFYWANPKRILMEVTEVKGNLDKRAKPSMLFAGDVNGKKRKWLVSQGDSKGSNHYGYGGIQDMLPDDPNHVIVALFKSDGLKLQKVDVRTGRMKYIGGPNEEVHAIALDRNHEPRFALRGEEDGSQTLLIRYGKKNDWRPFHLKGETKRPSASPLGFSRDNNTFYFLSNHEFPEMSLYAFDMQAKKLKLLYHNKRVDLLAGIYSRDKDLLGVVLMPDTPAVFWIDRQHPETVLRRNLLASFPGSAVTLTSYTRDGEKAVLHVRSDTNPGMFYMFDLKDNKASFLAEAYPWLEEKDMAVMEPIEVTARDGLKLYGYLTRPKGQDKHLPLIINPHGGPHGPRDMWGFNPEVQFLANRGYAVLQINYRGSGGYGVDFERAGYKKWGTDMQNDLTDAVHWAIDQGIADRDRICIYGGSYGGYAALMSVVREPDLYKCTIGYVGVYDLLVMQKAGDIPKSRSGKIFLKRVLPDTVEEQKAQSPAYNAEKIKAAIFIAHGERDQRVPMAQGIAMRKALDKVGKPYIWMQRDEGHGYFQQQNRHDFYSQMESFFAEHLKGDSGK